MAGTRSTIIILGMKCEFPVGEVDVFLDPYSIESVRTVESPDGRSCVVRTKSGDELPCGCAAEQFLDGLRRELDRMAEAGTPCDPPAVGHPEGVQLGGLAPAGPGDRPLPAGPMGEGR